MNENVQKGEVILYHPSETIKLEVRLENETVWLTQQQIADLFGTKRPAITKHLKNIYSSGELTEQGTCSILEHMGNDGKLTNEECLRSQIVTLNTKRGQHLKYMPYAFTQEGVAALSGVLRSKFAISINIHINNIVSLWQI